MAHVNSWYRKFSLENEITVFEINTETSVLRCGLFAQLWPCHLTSAATRREGAHATLPAPRRPGVPSSLTLSSSLVSLPPHRPPFPLASAVTNDPKAKTRGDLRRPSVESTQVADAQTKVQQVGVCPRATPARVADQDRSQLPVTGPLRSAPGRQLTPETPGPIWEGSVISSLLIRVQKATGSGIMSSLGV